MSELSLLVKLGALLILGVGALIVAYKCANWIYRTVNQTPPAPIAAQQPVPEPSAEGVISFTSAVSNLRETGT